MKRDICIAVATHKPYRMPDDAIYLPLHVGAALNPDVCKDMQADDTGDNISRLNGKYSELTGLYWMWKNCDADYKGLVHYRRLLGSRYKEARHEKDRYKRVVGKEELAALFEKTDIVVAKRRDYYIETVYGHYAHTFDGKQFDECRRVLKDSYPDYVSAWDRLMKAHGAHIFNMFVMQADLFDSYCEWLFRVLYSLDKRIDSRQYNEFDARYLGRVSERLLDPWLETNGLSYIELPVVSPEPIDWVKKGSGFLAAKFLGKKYERSF